MHSSMIVYYDEVSREWIDRLCEAGVTALGIHSRGGEAAVTDLCDMLEFIKGAEYRALIDYARARGLKIEYEMHAAGYLLPRELFRGQPEYFRMNGRGERTPDYNFCVTNEDALSIYAEHAAELALSLYGSDKDFYFWMDDGHDLHCHCPRCSQLSASDQQMLVLNRVIGAIRSRIPEARLAYLAYFDTIIPPSCIKPCDGIFLEYAPLQKYTANGEGAEALIAQERGMLLPLMRAFGKSGSKVLEYWYDNSMYSGWKKPPKKLCVDEAQMRREISEYAAMGFEYIASFACFLGEDYEELYGEVDVSEFGEAVRSRHRRGDRSYNKL